MLLTIVYLVQTYKAWYDVKLLPVCVWDGYLHIFLPTILMIGYGVVNTKIRLQNEVKVSKDLEDMRNIVGQIGAGIALTQDWYTMHNAVPKPANRKSKKQTDDPEAPRVDLEAVTALTQDTKPKKVARLRFTDVILANIGVYKLLSTFEDNKKDDFPEMDHEAFEIEENKRI